MFTNWFTRPTLYATTALALTGLVAWNTYSLYRLNNVVKCPMRKSDSNKCCLE